MGIIFSTMPIVIVLSMLYSIIESLYFESLSKFRFLLGIPVFKRLIDAGKIETHISIDKKIDTTDGLIRILADNKLYFRTHDDKPSFPKQTIIPIRIIGTLTETNQINIIGRIPIGITIFLLCFTVLPVTALIRDGISPAIVFLIAVWTFFGVSYFKEKRKLDNMIWELEQIIIFQKTNIKNIKE